MKRKNAEEYTDEDLKNLHHNNHEGAFLGYLNQSRHIIDKQKFILDWVKPESTDFVLECGSSSGKTCIDLSLKTGCRCLGIDFDEDAILISTKMREEYFPMLTGRCEFINGDLSTMQFDPQITKILMADFTEHIPDKVLLKILENLRAQFKNAKLYIYTPSRTHIFEIMKYNNIILKNPSGHINVKTPDELTQILCQTGWKIVDSKWRYSSMWYVRIVERTFASAPFIGKYFRRRIAMLAIPTQP